MKRILLGITLGTVLGAFAFKKMEESKLTDKVIKTAKKKLSDD